MLSEVALGELFRIGSSKRVLKAQWQTEGVPFYRGREVTCLAKEGFVDNELFISEELYSDYAEKYGVPTCGDIVITAIGTIGNSYIVREEDIFYFKDASVLWLKKTTDVCSEFINLWLKSPLLRDQLDEGNGATVDTLTIKKLQSVTVKLPPLKEQKRIAGILDEAFVGISQAVAHAEKNLANARELFESYLNNLFTQKGEGWVEKELSDVCSITSKLVDPRDSDFIDHLHIGAGNMVTMSNELIDVKTAREEGLKSGKFYFDNKMVLYSKIRPYLMKVAIPDFDGLCSADVYPLLPVTTELDRGFLYYLLLSRNFTEYAIAGSQRAGMPKVNRDCLFKYRAFFPDVPEQQRIVSQINQLSTETQRLEVIYQQKLKALVEFKQSILQKAFTGELTKTSTEVELTPITQTKPVSKKKVPSKAFIEAVLISQFVREMSNDKFALGRKRYNKLCYLAHRKNEDNVQQQYLKKAAGPYSPWAKYGGPEKIAMENGYIVSVKRGKYSGFVVGPSINEIDAYLQNYPVCGVVDWVVEKFQYATTDKLELLATVDFAAMDIMEKGKAVNLKSVKTLITANPEWAPKLKRSLFSDIGIQGAIKELAGLFPVTFLVTMLLRENKINSAK